MSSYEINIESECMELQLRFAEMLVKHSGNCNDAEMDLWHGHHVIKCKHCPFYCLSSNAASVNKIARCKAEQFLLDVKLRNIIET